MVLSDWIICTSTLKAGSALKGSEGGREGGRREMAVEVCLRDHRVVLGHGIVCGFAFCASVVRLIMATSSLMKELIKLMPVWCLQIVGS